MNFYNKIVFLDIDGVINIEKDHFKFFNQKCLTNLETIIKETNAKIVVSSSWRDLDEERMRNNFFENGFTEFLWDNIIGITVRGYYYVVKGSNLPIVRGNEIKQWVDRHLKYPWHSNPELTKEYQILREDGSFKMMKSNTLNTDYSYVIIDDDTDMLLEQRNNFVNTDIYEGLTQIKAQEAINILNYGK